ncbi:H-NS family nucleoid-associated regulatory protein [Propionivibrio sp.]|uniref:H-NS histone family protein n=1 Tax=Propionivibrio sp. TaxID=2212460 RepID=UPI003BF36D8E
MAKTYDEALKQIEDLKIEAEQLRKNEIANAVAEAKVIIDKYKLTAEDLGLAKKNRKGSPVKAPKAVKYRSDTNPNDTYGGKGPTPAWLNKKLAEGRSKEEFKVQEGHPG